MSSVMDTSSYYNLTNATTASATQNYKTSELENTLNKTSEATDEEMMNACKEFETYFVQQVFEEMKKTVHSSDDDNDYMQQFGDILTESYAKSVSDTEQLGIAKMLYESMKRNGE